MNKINAELILTLLSVKGIGRKTVSYLINTGIKDPTSEESVLTALEIAKVNKKRVPTVDINTIREAKISANSIIRTCTDLNIGIVTVLDEDYPDKLKNLEDRPVILFYKGNKDCLNKDDSVAIIGAREPSAHGEKIAQRLGSIFGREEFLVVSGLANGCDTFAHRGCLEVKGSTLAVLPGGIDCIYPASNKQLADRIVAEKGCLVSEYLPGQKPTKHFFVDRDRLQSAFSSGIIVVECGETSGTMHTVGFAKEQGRVIGCYKHKSKFKEVEKIKGNLKLLEDKTIYEIKDPKSIQNYITVVKDRNIEKKEFQTLQQGQMSLFG